MSYGNPSDEVAENYLEALQNLQMNSRYEISNLTVIAKENTEHALAISEALRNHIMQTSPQKKLPAFYVLDSVVKNVGTPYTLFFGRQLYSTFMEAYALVDTNVRRKMDEMLKTWKEPVPGSIDTRPVFPPEVTRPIENALIKARTSALEREQTRTQQQLLGRGRPLASPTPYRDSPTPPGIVRQAVHGPPGYNTNYNQPYPPPTSGQQQYPPSSNQQYHPPENLPYSLTNNQAHPPPAGNQQSYPLPNNQQYPPNNQQHYVPVSQQQYPPANGQQYSNPQNGLQPHGLPQRPPSQQYSQQPASVSSWQSLPQGYSAPENSLDTLKRDLAKLISTFRADFAQSPWDTRIQTRLKAFLDLDTILSRQELPPDQIAHIRKQVPELSEAAQPPHHEVQTTPAPLPLSTPVAPAQSSAQQPSLSSILGPGALAALLAARQSATPQPTHPSPSIRSPQQVHAQPVYNPTSTAISSATPVPEPNALLASLRAAGLLSGLATASTPNPPPSALARNLPPGFPPPPPPFISTPPNSSRTPLAEIPNDVVLKPASLKIPRPHLISNLYERLGAPCTQCGRRFQSDEESRKKKAAHMDWHFRAAHRMTEAERRGQHRSWYIDEMDWIRSREVGDDQEPNTGDSPNGKAATVKQPKLQYLAVPDDPSLAKGVCPICQEKFEMKWLDDAQEFVWMDAKQVGDRIYHATCYAEAYGSGGDSKQVKRTTPSPVLGKRKAEDEHIASRPKIKTEPRD